MTLDRRADDGFDPLQRLTILGRDERDGLTGRFGARGASDAVNVVVGALRDVVVDDVRDPRDVEPARGDIRRDEDPRFAPTELLERRVSLFLRAVAMDRFATQPPLVQMTGQATRPELGAHEDDGRVDLLAAEEREQCCFFLIARHLDDALANRIDRAAVADLDLFGIVQELLRDRSDLRTHRRGEHQRLSGRRELLQNAPDVGHEAEVEHAIGLVEHDDLDGRKIHVIVLHVIEDAARRADQNVAARTNAALLGSERHPADDERRGHARVVGEARHLLVDLQGELSSRREHEGAAHAPRLRNQALEDGDQERRRLAGARLCRTDHVFARQKDWDGLALDRGHRIEPHVVNAVFYPRVERKVVESLYTVVHFPPNIV